MAYLGIIWHSFVTRWGQNGVKEIVNGVKNIIDGVNKNFEVLHLTMGIKLYLL